MGYSKRIETLCALLKPTTTFADVGCDHGYCSEYMLKNELCKFAILSDISKGSLEKATTLLGEYVKAGKAKGVLGNGFFGVPKDTEEVLIAGMGGEEIVAILSHERYGFMPEKFVFQPMLNPDKLRAYILDNGGFIERDYTFMADGKFYDVIVGGKAADKTTEPYTDAEYEYGRENLQTMPKAFIQRTQKQLKNTNAYLSRENLQEESRAALEENRKRLEGVLSGEIK